MASGNQYLRALLAGKSDGYRGELSARTQGADRTPRVQLMAWLSHCGAGSRRQPRLGGRQCRPRCCPAGLCPTRLSPRRMLVSLRMQSKATGRALTTAVSPLSSSSDGVPIKLSAVGDAWVPSTELPSRHCKPEGLGSCCTGAAGGDW